MSGAIRHPSFGAAQAGPIPARAGIGLRLPHHCRVLEQGRVADWLEVHAENYMSGGVHSEELETIGRDHPLSLHAVGLSLGSVEPVREDHLQALADLIARCQPGLVSDHLSWSRSGGTYFPDLLPLPYTEEALAVTARNIDRVQTVLGRPLLVENPSSYFAIPGSAMSEPEFLGELARRCGCGVLLDLNNIYVSARNRGDDPFRILPAYLAAIPAGAIGEIHLAGHLVETLEDGRELRIDDHGSAVCPDVWRLYENVIAALGDRPTLIEWDTAIPPLEILQAEASTAQAIMDRTIVKESRYALAG
ncbi:MAG TPA: DUF692 domain-containing protein [Rhizomicrobium sp.]|jgi:hypothetical protein|nr:DUF692 domain-containing protein [Rhizomicrobium sp.]